MLRKDVATRWAEECQKACDKIKEYLSKSPVLVPPEPGRPLLLYLSVLDGAFGCKAVKGKALADHLAQNPVDGEYKSLKTYFPDEEVSFVGEDIIEAYDGWRMFFDGAANFKGVDIRVVLVSETDQYYPVSAKLRFPCTNNMAEYKAYILGLILAIDMSIKELLRFTKIEFKHVPRTQNEFAYALATLSSMIQHPDKNFINHILIGIHKQPAYCAHVEEEFDSNLWFHDIKEYLEKGEYPGNAIHT
ncbi:uncharacterized protein [Nicotiana tomentosiformis]|uniref:uncharacterized protein n=1 Tax=Nicotiana tomentosiformis TaxID=4098 RepID=UPI00388C3FC9